MQHFKTIGRLGNILRISEFSWNSRDATVTSSYRNIFRVTGPLWGESIGHRWISQKKPVTRSFDVFFDLCPNKRLGKHARLRWFESPSRSLWRHCNAYIATAPWNPFHLGFFIAIQSRCVIHYIMTQNLINPSLHTFAHGMLKNCCDMPAIKLL